MSQLQPSVAGMHYTAKYTSTFATTRVPPPPPGGPSRSCAHGSTHLWQTKTKEATAGRWRFLSFLPHLSLHNLDGCHHCHHTPTSYQPYSAEFSLLFTDRTSPGMATSYKTMQSACFLPEARALVEEIHKEEGATLPASLTDCLKQWQQAGRGSGRGGAEAAEDPAEGVGQGILKG